MAGPAQTARTFWIDPKEQVIGIIMMATRVARLRTELPNAVYQAIVD